MDDPSIPPQVKVNPMRIRYSHLLNPPPIPSRDLAMNIVGWSKHGNTYVSRLCFPNATILCISGQAIMQLADWEDRHCGEPHPFCEAMKYCLNAKHICVTMPTITFEDRTRYIHMRTAQDHLYLSPEAQSLHKARVEEGFVSFITSGPNIAVRTLRRFTRNAAETWSIHNALNITIPYSEALTRVFFSTYLSRKVSWPAGVNVADRIEMLVDLAGGVQRRKKIGLRYGYAPTIQAWELIGANKIGGTMEEWTKMEEQIIKKEPHWAKEDFRIIDWEDAELCVCCDGKGGL